MVVKAGVRFFLASRHGFNSLGESDQQISRLPYLIYNTKRNSGEQAGKFACRVLYR